MKIYILHLTKAMHDFEHGFYRAYVGHTLLLDCPNDAEFQRIFNQYFDCFNAERYEVLVSTCDEDDLDYDCDLEHMQSINDLDEENPFMLDESDRREVWHTLNEHKYGQVSVDKSICAMFNYLACTNFG